MDDSLPPDRTITPERLEELYQRAKREAFNAFAETRHLYAENGSGPRPADELSYRELMEQWDTLERQGTVTVSVTLYGKEIVISGREGLRRATVNRAWVEGTTVTGEPYSSQEKIVTLRLCVRVDPRP